MKIKDTETTPQHTAQKTEGEIRVAPYFHRWFYYSEGVAHGLKAGAKTMKTLNMLRNGRAARGSGGLFSKEGLIPGMLLGLAVSYGLLLVWLAVKEIWG